MIRELVGRPAARTALRVIVVGGAAVAGLWYGAYRVEEWYVGQVPPAGVTTLPLAVRVDVVARPEDEVTAALLEPAVREVLRARAPWVRVADGARNVLDVKIELGPMKQDPGGYEGWVRMSFRQARWVPALVARPPDWEQKIFVFGKPPELGSAPRDNVRGAVRIGTRNFIRMGLFRNWGMQVLLQAGADVVAAEGGRPGRGEIEDGVDLPVGAG